MIFNLITKLQGKIAVAAACAQAVATFPLCGGEAPWQPVTFHELDKIEADQPRTVHIRGFLYGTQEGRLVLSSEPGLKSCCIGSAAKRLHQILVEGEIAPPSGPSLAVTLEGKLDVDAKREFPYRLSDAAVVPEESSSTILLAAAAALLGAIIFFRRKKKK